MENLEGMIYVIGNFGFPIMIALYLLIRFEKKIESLTASILELQNKDKN